MELAFPSGRTADEIVVDDAAGLAWVANLGCLDLNPHPVRADDLDHPDELRVDLDPVPGVPWDDVRRVALVVREALADVGLVGWPKTSGSRGIHVNVRIERRWTFPEVRRAALALARDVERRAPALATSRWWKEERHGVFIDYNQNAKDRTVASAYSVRPRPDARVSMPLVWDEVAEVDAADFTLRTVPERFARDGDAHEGIDDAAGSLEALLELSARHETEGLGDAPWPPNYAKTADEPPRVAPSKRRMSTKPLIEIGRAAKQPDAIAGLERWKARHPGCLAAPPAGGRPGGLDARPLDDLDPDPPQPGERPARAAPAPGAARPGLRPVGGIRLARSKPPSGASASQDEGDRLSKGSSQHEHQGGGQLLHGPLPDVRRSATLHRGACMDDRDEDLERDEGDPLSDGGALVIRNPDRLSCSLA